ncbi:MAG: molybdopterin molybdotransferase MoeA [Candidatus Omnitrophica bacterium]|nr:molybdopterin molybdotransferase MoeA [Candidatus Omnitrophota bacterium]
MPSAAGIRRQPRSCCDGSGAWLPGRHGRPLRAGECVSIATGAKLPAGADAVVKKENARLTPDGRVEIFRSVPRGLDVDIRGCDYRKDSLLLKQGARLNAPRLALLASQGYDAVRVRRSPHAALLTTGDEVVSPGRIRRDGRIWDATRPMVLAALKEMGIPVADLGHARDLESSLEKKIRRGLTRDILIVTGGVSVGERDLLPEVLRHAGVRCLFHRVAIRPGKPLWFGRRGHCLVFGLPGNPVASLITFSLFVRPAIACMLGEGPFYRFREGILTKDVYNKEDRLSFLPGRLLFRGGSGRIVPLAFRGSADLFHTRLADCFFMVPPRRAQKKGSKILYFMI